MIDLVTRALVAHISSRTPDLGPWVVLHSLSAADGAPGANKLVWCLISVDEHEHLRNRPPVPVADGYERAPMQLRLQYLATYFGPHDEAMTRLARLLAVFHTTPILGPAELPAEVSERIASLTVRLRNTTADERNQVWTALGRPGRLSLYYTVDVVPVDLLEGPEGWGRVEEHRVTYVGAP